MKRWILFASVIALWLLVSACYNPFKNPFSSGGGSSGDDGENVSTLPERVIEATNSYSIAIGGVAPGRDELVIYDDSGEVIDFSGKTLVCEPDDDILIVRPRPDYDTAADGSGVMLIARSPGVTAVRCTANGEELDQVFEVTIPPQSMIQILVAEASMQIDDEADVESDSVQLDSESPTANALGSVIRNRINFTNNRENTSLFEVDEEDYYSDPPASYYDAVILAEGQFSPADPDDPSYTVFDDAQDRNFLDDDLLVAYDQAVLTAAGIFNGDIADTTTGAFAFMSPTAEEWNELTTAWSMYSLILPEGGGFTDASFPYFAPIQILIHPDVWRYDNGLPSFVFARMRTGEDPAVTKNP